MHYYVYVCSYWLISLSCLVSILRFTKWSYLNFLHGTFRNAQKQWIRFFRSIILMINLLNLERDHAVLMDLYSKYVEMRDDDPWHRCSMQQESIMHSLWDCDELRDFYCLETSTRRVSLAHIYREANKCAGFFLANLGHTGSFDVSFLDVYPPSLAPHKKKVHAIIYLLQKKYHILIRKS